jgi:phosphate-selective porin
VTLRTAAGVVLAVLAAAPPSTAAAQSLRIGDAIRIEPKARVQVDVRAADASDESDVDIDLARRRVGISGQVTRHVEFEVEREVDSTGRWRDAFVDVHANRAIQVRAGHFKVPFSREQLTGAGDLDFIDRSRAADLLAPGRSAGVALHGRVIRRVVGYEAGAFMRDGTHDGLPGPAASEPTVAARVTVRLRGGSRRAGSIADVELGMAAATSELSEGRSSFRGRLTSKDLFFSPVLVSGRRLRVGGDLDWRPGPFGVRGEFLRADDARQHQGLLGETLPPLRAQGWYVSGVWAVAGRAAHATANDSFAVRGLAGLELAARVEQLSFGTPGATGAQVWTPRAEQLSTVTDRAWTVGINWTLNRLVRIQANAVHESVVNRSRGASAPRAAWSPVARVQVAL